MANRAVEVMNGQIHLDLDAVKAYEQAIEAADSSDIKERLGEFKGDHERHVRELTEKVRACGGEPAEDRDVKGFFIEGFTKLTSWGDKSTLVAMRVNEELTNRSYESALENELPDDVCALLERNLADERRHLSWIKETLASKGWAEVEEEEAITEEAGPPPPEHPVA